MQNENDRNSSAVWKIIAFIIPISITLFVVFYGNGQCFQPNPPTWIVPVLNLICTNRQSSTPPTSPISTTNANPKVLLEEDFNDGQAQDFQIVSGNWQILSDNGNMVWDVNNPSSADYVGVNLGVVMWQNYTIQYRLKMMNFVSNATPEVIVYFRGDNLGNSNVQAFTPDFNGDKLITFAKTVNRSGWQAISTAIYPFVTQKWYTIQIVAQDNRFRIYVDNELVIDTTDSQITSGNTGLQVGPGAHVRFDDI